MILNICLRLMLLLRMATYGYVSCSLTSQPQKTILLRSSPCPLKIVVGNWTLQCLTEGELQITNSDGQAQATILKEDLAGFTFESNKGKYH